MVAAQRCRHRGGRELEFLGKTFASLGEWSHGGGVCAGPTEFTEFDGYVPDAGPVLDPCAPETAYSVTELEKRRRVSVSVLP